MPMHLKNTLTRYGAVAQLFHWAIVALVITQFVLARRAEGLSPVAKIGVLATHKSVGITILGLALLRLTWRLFNPVPPLPAGAPRWQDRAAHVSHFLLYALLFITPVLGWLMSSARNCQRGVPAGSGGTGLNSRHVSRSSASPRIVMPTDLCVARTPILATGDKPSARLASTNCVMTSATIAQWNSCATAPYRVRVFLRCMGMSTGQTAGSLSD